MPDAGVRLGAEQDGDGDRAGDADPAEVVAYQVDDHHVLRAVLRRGLELGPLHRGLFLVGGASRGALDGLGGDRVRDTAEEQLGRQRRDRGVSRARGGDADEGGVGRVERGHALAERVERVAGELRLRAQGDVGLEDVPLVDVLDRPADRLLVPVRSGNEAERAELVAGRARVGKLSAGRGAARHDQGRAAVQLVEPPLKGFGALLCPHRLEVPLPRRPVPAQHVVVVAEPPGGQGARPGRRQRLAARAVAEVADPATAEGTVFSGHAEVAEVTVEDVVQPARCRPDRHGLGGDHVRAAVPRAAQGDRMRVIPHEPQHVGRGEVPPQWSARDKRSRSRHSQTPHSGHSQRLTGHDGHAP